jgi:phosphoketolase
MTAVTSKPKTPAFCEGIQHFADALPDFDDYGQAPAIAADAQAITDPTDPAAVYQTLLAADALRYLTLQMTASKQSGHPRRLCQHRRHHCCASHAGPQEFDY